MSWNWSEVRFLSPRVQKPIPASEQQQTNLWRALNLYRTSGRTRPLITKIQSLFFIEGPINHKDPSSHIWFIWRLCEQSSSLQLKMTRDGVICRLWEKISTWKMSNAISRTSQLNEMSYSVENALNIQWLLSNYLLINQLTVSSLRLVRSYKMWSDGFDLQATVERM